MLHNSCPNDSNKLPYKFQSKNRGTSLLVSILWLWPLTIIFRYLTLFHLIRGTREQRLNVIVWGKWHATGNDLHNSHFVVLVVIIYHKYKSFIKCWLIISVYNNLTIFIQQNKSIKRILIEDQIIPLTYIESVCGSVICYCINS